MKRVKKRFSLMVAIFALFTAFVCCAVSVYAWYVAGDKAGSITLQFARVNSEVYFYTARDTSLNGVPDLISDSDKPVENEEEKHDLYYTENRYFNFVEKTEAKTETEGQTFDEVSLSGFLAGIVPTKIFTAKLSLVNKGDTTNEIDIKLKEKTFTSDEKDKAKIYSTFAVRVVKVINAGESSDTPTYEKGEWMYLCDTATAGDSWSFAAMSAQSDNLSGLDAQNKADNLNADGSYKKVLNVCDYWLQFQMIPYEDLLQKDSFVSLGITEEDYQAMQGVSNAVSFNLSVLFEVIV